MVAPNGGYLADNITVIAGSLLHYPFTLTCARRPSAVYSLLPCSVTSRLPNSRWRSVLRSPDLPQHSQTVPRLPGPLNIFCTYMMQMSNLSVSSCQWATNVGYSGLSETSGPSSARSSSVKPSSPNPTAMINDPPVEDHRRFTAR